MIDYYSSHNNYLKNAKSLSSLHYHYHYPKYFLISVSCLPLSDLPAVGSDNHKGVEGFSVVSVLLLCSTSISKVLLVEVINTDLVQI